MILECLFVAMNRPDDHRRDAGTQSYYRGDVDQAFYRFDVVIWCGWSQLAWMFARSAVALY